MAVQQVGGGNTFASENSTISSDIASGNLQGQVDASQQESIQAEQIQQEAKDNQIQDQTASAILNDMTA